MLRRSKIFSCAASTATASLSHHDESHLQQQSNKPVRADIMSILEQSKLKEQQALEQERLTIQSHKKNAEIVKNAFRRLLAQPHYGQCPMRRKAISQAIKTVAETSSTRFPPSSHQGGAFSCSSSSSSSSTLPPINVNDLVLDSVRDGVDKRYPFLGAGLRRVALEALDPSLTNYTCTSPLGGPIPYDEVESHIERIKEFAKFLNPQWIVAPVGRHRRGAIASRSIDVLITDPSTRTSGANFSNSLHQDAPFVVLARMKHAMESAGYAIFCHQQRGKGIATLAALVQHEPFSTNSSPKNNENTTATTKTTSCSPSFIADEEKYLAKKTINNNHNNTTNEQNQNRPESSSSEQQPIFNFSSSTTSLHQQRLEKKTSSINNNNNIQQQEKKFDIAGGHVPHEYVSPKSESLMEKILKLHRRQQARAEREREKEILLLKSKTEEENIKTTEDELQEKKSDVVDSERQDRKMNHNKNESDDEDDDDKTLDQEELDLCMELALEECPPRKSRKVSLPQTSGGVLRDIHSEVEEDDDNDNRAPETAQSQHHHDEEGKKESSSSSSERSVDADDEEDDEILGDRTQQNNARSIQQQQGQTSTSKTTKTTNSSSSSSSTSSSSSSVSSTSSTPVFSSDLEKLEKKSIEIKKAKGAKQYSMTHNAGITITKHFPLNPKQVPRRLNIVWAPYDRFYALMLLLTGPRDFSSFLIDRAPRFGYRLSEDGVFETINVSNPLEQETQNHHQHHQQNLQQVATLEQSHKLSQEQYDDDREQDMTLEAAEQNEKDRLAATATKRAYRKFEIAPHTKNEVVINSESDLLEKLRMTYLSPMDR